MTLYCDLSMDDVVIWEGAPCHYGQFINPQSYLAFSGILFFADTQGISDPTYDRLEDRYCLWCGFADSAPVLIPLQNLPSQTFSVTLNGQNCSMSIYEKSAEETMYTPTATWDCPDSIVGGTSIHQLVTVTAEAGCTFTWGVFVPPYPMAPITCTAGFLGVIETVYVNVGGSKSAVLSNAETIDFEGFASGILTFPVYIVCNVRLGDGVTRLSKLLLVTGGGPPVIKSFTASPASITSGESSTLSWVVN